MIDVGVAEDHRVDLLRLEGKTGVAAIAFAAAALEQSAVEKQRFSGRFDLMHGAGDRPGGSVKGDCRRQRLLASSIHYDIVRQSCQRRRSIEEFCFGWGTGILT